MSFFTISRCQVLRLCNLCNSFARRKFKDDSLQIQHALKIERIVLPSANVIQERGYKKLLKLKKYNLPKLDFKSGDLIEQKQLPPDEIHFLYKDIKELEDAPPELRRLFTVGFASGKEKLQHRHLIVQDRISKVTGSAQNLEKYIGFLTVQIQNMVPYCQKKRQNKRAKVICKEKIDKRQKLLKILSRTDYDRFQWLLKELKIEYTPRTKASMVKLSKRQTILKAKEDEVNEQKIQKMEELRQKFAEEKEKFMQHKNSVLEDIEKDIEKYQLDKERIIRSYKEYLEDLKPKRQEKPLVSPTPPRYQK